ncbi:MAG: hypothetical protein ACOYJV_01625 [Aminivibrio sp.]|jgi:hypothetical protein
MTTVKKYEVPKFSWEDEMPIRCKECPHSRFISGILLMNSDLKRDNSALREHVELISRVLKTFRFDMRKQFEAEIKMETKSDLRRR